MTSKSPYTAAALKNPTMKPARPARFLPCLAAGHNTVKPVANSTPKHAPVTSCMPSPCCAASPEPCMTMQPATNGATTDTIMLADPARDGEPQPMWGASSATVPAFSIALQANSCLSQLTEAVNAGSCASTVIRAAPAQCSSRCRLRCSVRCRMKQQWSESSHEHVHWGHQKLAVYLRAAGAQAWPTPPWFCTVSAMIQPSGTPCSASASMPDVAACSCAMLTPPLEARRAAAGCSTGSVLAASGKSRDLQATVLWTASQQWCDAPCKGVTPRCGNGSGTVSAVRHDCTTSAGRRQQQQQQQQLG